MLDPTAREAVLDYGDADFTILRAGSYVVCAVTGARIPLEELRYWSPVLQEAYADAGVALKRWEELKAKGEAP